MTPFHRELRQAIEARGGLHNAHLHLDRAGTYHDTVALLEAKGVAAGEHLSLAEKHAVIPLVHDSNMYAPTELHTRVSAHVDDLIACGTRRAETVVDTTADGVGTSALDALRNIACARADAIELRVGAYSPLGFRDDEPHRWEVLEAGAHEADFIGLLPERDDVRRYPAHIGFDECCRRGLALARALHKPIQIHVDQAHHAHERGAERVVALLRDDPALRSSGGIDREAPPVVWLVHALSPSTYAEPRFRALADDLAALHVGVICCPGAALSMRQLRPLVSPTTNSIARVLEFAAAGVWVRLGTDNVCDITSPMSTVDLMDELRILADGLRYYDIPFLAALAAGVRPDPATLERLRVHLARETASIAATIAELEVSAP